MNLSVDGVSANANKQDVLTPITTFLGDHGQATLSSTNDTSKGVRALQLPPSCLHLPTQRDASGSLGVELLFY